MAVPGPYIGSMTKAQRARMGTGKNLTRYYTYRAPQKGRKDNDILKLAANQVAKFAEGRGWYAAPRPAGGGGGPPSPGRGGGGTSSSSSTARSMASYSLDEFVAMLQAKQQAALDAQLNDTRRRSLAHMSALGGFGTGLQDFAREQWGAVNQGYQQAGAAQTAGAEGLGSQVGAQVAAARAGQEALGAGLGYTGGTDLPTAAAAQAQVASEGGAQTGAMMGQVGSAWGGYGATRPDYLGFMTGHQQMQLSRDQIELERDLRSKYLELAMDNPKTALEMWGAIQENKRQNVSTSLAQQTLQQNIAMQKANLKAKYAQMRADATTAAEKRSLDRWYKEQTLGLRQQELAISQQNADAAMIRATKPPAPTKQSGYAAGNYNQKVATAVSELPGIFDDSGHKKWQGRAEYAFGVLWPQIAPHVSAANKAAAQKLLRDRIRKAAKNYVPAASSGGIWGG